MKKAQKTKMKQAATGSGRRASGAPVARLTLSGFYRAFLLIATMAAMCSPAHALVTIWESAETHGWRERANITLVGLDGAHVDEGVTALKASVDATLPGTLEARIESMDFLAQAATPLADGFSLRIFAQPTNGATGIPAVRLELVAEDDTVMAGSDTPLAASSWSATTLPAAAVTKDFKRINIIITANGSTGKFDLWFDNLRRDGVLMDGFENRFATAIQPIELEGVAAGNACDTGHLASRAMLGLPAETPVYGLEWAGDDGTFGLQFDLRSELNVTTATMLAFTACIPTGGARPSIAITLSDGAANPQLADTVQFAAGNTWQRFRMPLRQAALESGFNPEHVTQMTMKFQNSGAAGRLYLGNFAFFNYSDADSRWVLFQ